MVYDLQKDYVYPVVHTIYIRQQEVVIECLRDNQLHLSGDGHFGSPIIKNSLNLFIFLGKDKLKIVFP